MGGFASEYNEKQSEISREVLSRIPTPKEIRSTEDAEDYLVAKGYFGNGHKLSSEDYETRPYAWSPERGLKTIGGRVSLEKMTTEGARLICETADMVYEKFPGFAGFVGGANEDDDTSYAGYYGSGSVHINPSIFDESERYNDGGGEDPEIKARGQFIRARGVVAHELSHGLDAYLCKKFPNVVDSVYYASSDGRGNYMDTVAKAIFEKAAKNLGEKKSDFKQKISRYACKNDIEAFAEAMSEYIVSENPRPEAREIGRQVEYLIQNGKLAGKEK